MYPSSHCQSFDVFDTCLVRSLASPQDVFHLLGQRLFEAADSPYTEDDVHEFVRERVIAERRAREISSKEDLSLTDIYTHYRTPPALALSPGDVREAELAIERELLHPVPEMAARITTLCEQGVHIVYITDIFLPGTFIGDMLRENGFPLQKNSLFVSGDIGLTKHSGSLFHHVLQALSLEPGQLHHWGDNPHSDVAVPQRLGIKTTHFRSACLTSLESHDLGRTGRTCLHTSALSGASRLVRLRSTQSKLPRDLGEVVADVVAPMVTGFVAWVLENAHQVGCRKLWFVARDGQIMHRVAQALAPDDSIEFLYLHGSRQAWFLPSIETFDPEQTDWLFIQGHSARPRDIVAKLDCTPAEVERALGTSLDNDFWEESLGNETSALLDVLQTDAVRRMVEDKARTARKNLVGYLKQHGVRNGDPITLVDIGWTLKAQKALGDILNASGLSCSVTGFYFGISQNALPASEAGPYRAYFLERDNWFDRTQPMNHLFRNANIVEQVFTAATHGQTAGYHWVNEEYAPRLKEDSRDKRTLELIAAMQEQVVAFARLVRDGGWGRSIESIWRRNHVLLERFLSSPSKRLAEAVADFSSFDDQNESRKRPLARAITIGLLAQALCLDTPVEPLVKRPDFSDSFDWVEGSIALSPEWMQTLLKRPEIIERLKLLRKSL